MVGRCQCSCARRLPPNGREVLSIRANISLTHPSPLRGERGRGLRGQRTLPVPSPTLPGHCESSILLHCPCCAWQGRFAPHPRPLSPVRGEGSQMLFMPESQRHWLSRMAAACGQKTPQTPSTASAPRLPSLFVLSGSLNRPASESHVTSTAAGHHRALAAGRESKQVTENNQASR